jgi:hypothetical protein
MVKPVVLIPWIRGVCMGMGIFGPSPCGPSLFSKVEVSTFQVSRVAMVKDYTNDIMINFYVRFVSSLYRFKYSASIGNRHVHPFSASRQYQL